MWREARPSSPEAASNAKPRRRDALVPAIRVLLANDRQIILWGLERLIDAQAPRMKVVAKAISNAELLSQTVRHHPDVTLLDRSPVADGGSWPFYRCAPSPPGSCG